MKAHDDMVLRQIYEQVFHKTLNCCIFQKGLFYPSICFFLQASLRTPTVATTQLNHRASRFDPPAVQPNGEALPLPSHIARRRIEPQVLKSATQDIILNRPGYATEALETVKRTISPDRF